MEKRTPHCKLTVVKALVEAGKVRTTHAARVGANELGLALSEMLDVVMAHAARSVEPAMGCVTVEMKTSFMRPAKGALTAHGTLLHRTRSLAFVDPVTGAQRVFESQQSLNLSTGG